MVFQQSTPLSSRGAMVCRCSRNTLGSAGWDPGQAVPVLDEVQGLLDGGQPGLVEGLGVLVVVVSSEVMLMPAIHAFPSPSRSRTFM